ncbi:MAG TPA: hypothetical protein VMT67_03065 [Terriglobales bacterium]|nr:hypothetical protein [Terriglobales bacterium]
MTLLRWTPEEDAVLRDRWMRDTPEMIGADMNRSADGVKKRAQKLGLLPRTSGRRVGHVLSEEAKKSFQMHRYHAKQAKALHARPITRDPFIAILFGACEAVKAIVLPSHVYRQTMDTSDELGAAA